MAIGLLLSLSAVALRVGGGPAQCIRSVPRLSRTPPPVASDAEVNMADAATATIDQVMGMLDAHTEPPKGLMPLKEAISGGDNGIISEKLYCLLIEQTLDYEVKQPKDGELPVLVATDTDYSNTDNPEVRRKIGYTYNYGIQMFTKGLIKQEPLQEIVLVCAAADRTGPSPKLKAAHHLSCSRLCAGAHRVACWPGWPGPRSVAFYSFGSLSVDTPSFYTGSSL